MVSNSSASGQGAKKSLTPDRALVKVIHDEPVRGMGGGVRPLNLRVQPPAIGLLAGLQGAGKTTTAAKIALWLKTREKKRVLLVSTDVRRPAALLQLERLGQQLDVDVAPASPTDKPLHIAVNALAEARRGRHDVLPVDIWSSLAPGWAPILPFVASLAPPVAGSSVPWPRSFPTRWYRFACGHRCP